jgi:hypothetical protein
MNWAHGSLWRKASYAEEPLNGRADRGDIEGIGGGLESAEWCRKHGISEQTFYSWKATYGGLEVSDARWLRLQGGAIKKSGEPTGEGEKP